MASRKEDRFGPHELYLGIDVGKSFHWAIAVDGEGAVVIDRPLRNRQAEIDELIAEAGDGALVVVDQKNNIGSLVVRRCRAAGVDVGYLPGKSMKQARDMFPGTAKTDRIDAEIIARTALGMRRAVLPIAESDDLGASVSLLSSQLAYATRRSTMGRGLRHRVGRQEALPRALRQAPREGGGTGRPLGRGGRLGARRVAPGRRGRAGQEPGGRDTCRRLREGVDRARAGAAPLRR